VVVTVTGRAAVAPPAPVIVKVQVPTPTGVTVIVAPAIAAVAIVVGQPVEAKAAVPFACAIVAVFAFVVPTALKLRLVGAMATGPGFGVGVAVGVGVGVGVATGAAEVGDVGKTVPSGPHPASEATKKIEITQLRIRRKSCMYTPKKLYRGGYVAQRLYCTFGRSYNLKRPQKTLRRVFVRGSHAIALQCGGNIAFISWPRRQM
jgi:hypothetical protein